MDKQTIMAMAANNPQVQQAADVIEARIANMPGITENMVDQLVATLEYVLQNPQEYPKVRDAAIRAGFGSEQDFPAEFDPVLIVSMLVALYEVQARYQSGGSQAFARGGLAQAAQRVAAAGRGGDTMLAHINPREASVLARMGGSGTVNPTTGLVEFKGGVGKLVAAVAPVAIGILAPAMLPALGGFISGGALSGAAASALGGAALGAVSSEMSGGDPLKGAIGGAIGGGGASALGSGVSEAMDLGLGSTAQNVLGSTLAGATQGALTGEGATTGAMQGALGGYMGSTLSDAASGVGGPLGAGLQSAGTQVGNALTMGATPEQALAQGALTGLAAGYASATKPSDIAIDEMVQTPSGVRKLTSEFTVGETAINPETGENYMPAGESPLLKMASASGATSAPTTGSVLGTAASTLPLLALFSSAQTPEQVQQAVAGMTPEQKEYFNRPMRTWNWDTLSAAAKMQGLPLGSYIARNWDKVGGGMYDNPVASTTQNLAHGGVLQRLAQGGGSGRDDTIDAKLSDGEYVMDAETVSLLGDGSTKDGARRLDQMRAKIREHKGKSMARGKFSANAKSPLAYLKEAA